MVAPEAIAPAAALARCVAALAATPELACVAGAAAGGTGGNAGTLG